MMCSTVLHGGVCHRTLTPNKSGNKMEKKKNVYIMIHISITLPYTTRQLTDIRWIHGTSLKDHVGNVDILRRAKLTQV